eukprot:PhF_6_TR43321/c0_g1_i1/m.66204
MSARVVDQQAVFQRAQQEQTVATNVQTAILTYVSCLELGVGILRSHFVQHDILNEQNFEECMVMSSQCLQRISNLSSFHISGNGGGTPSSSFNNGSQPPTVPPQRTRKQSASNNANPNNQNNTFLEGVFRNISFPLGAVKKGIGQLTEAVVPSSARQRVKSNPLLNSVGGRVGGCSINNSSSRNQYVDVQSSTDDVELKDRGDEWTSFAHQHFRHTDSRTVTSDSLWMRNVKDLPLDKHTLAITEHLDSVFKAPGHAVNVMIDAFAVRCRDLHARKVATLEDVCKDTMLFRDAASRLATVKMCRWKENPRFVEIYLAMMRTAMLTQIETKIFTLWTSTFLNEDSKIHKRLKDLAASATKVTNFFPNAQKEILVLEKCTSHQMMMSQMVKALQCVTVELCQAHRLPEGSELGADKFLPAVFAATYRVPLKYAWSMIHFVSDMSGVEEASLKGEEGYALATFTCVLTHLLNAPQEELNVDTPFKPIAIPALLTGDASSSMSFSPSIVFSPDVKSSNNLATASPIGTSLDLRSVHHPLMSIPRLSLPESATNT